MSTTHLFHGRLTFWSIFLTIMLSKCCGISLDCKPISLQGSGTIGAFNVQCDLSRCIRENETVVWTFANCTLIGSCDIGGCNGTITNYRLSSYPKVYLLYNMENAGTGPYLFSIYNLSTIVAQSIISDSNVTYLDCNFLPNPTCQFADSQNISDLLNNEQDPSEATQWETTTFRPTKQNGYESDITKKILTSTIMTNSTPTPTSLSTGSVGKKNMSTLKLPIFVYAIIGIVAVIVILSSICTCFIGCQMYKRGTFRPQARYDGRAAGTRADSELHSMAMAGPLEAARSSACCSTNAIANTGQTRESFYEVPYAISDGSKPPLPPRSSRISESDFKNGPEDKLSESMAGLLLSNIQGASSSGRGYVRRAILCLMFLMTHRLNHQK